MKPEITKENVVGVVFELGRKVYKVLAINNNGTLDLERLNSITFASTKNMYFNNIHFSRLNDSQYIIISSPQHNTFTQLFPFNFKP